MPAMAAIDHISEVITRINDIQGTIASAVEQQTATTNEITRHVTEAATGAGRDRRERHRGGAGGSGHVVGGRVGAGRRPGPRAIGGGAQPDRFALRRRGVGAAPSDARRPRYGHGHEIRLRTESGRGRTGMTGGNGMGTAG